MLIAILFVYSLFRFQLMFTQTDHKINTRWGNNFDDKFASLIKKQKHSRSIHAALLSVGSCVCCVLKCKSQKTSQRKHAEIDERRINKLNKFRANVNPNNRIFFVCRRLPCYYCYHKFE